MKIVDREATNAVDPIVRKKNPVTVVRRELYPPTPGAEPQTPVVIPVQKPRR